MVDKSHVGIFLMTMLTVGAFMPIANSQTVPADGADFPGQMRLILSKAIYAVANVETNILFR